MIDNTEINRGYKATELGAVPEEWKITHLKELGTLSDGDWILNKDYSESGVRLIQVGDIGIGKFMGKSSRFIKYERALELKCTFLQIDDILISRMADPIGRSCIFPKVDYPAITAVDIAIFRINQKIVDLDFVIFALNSPQSLSQANKLAGGVTRQRASRKNLERLILPLPPLPEQRAIAATLRTVQEAKEKTDAVIAATKALKAAMMRHLFMYGPVPPEEAERIALKETEIGQVPEGWEIKKIGDVTIFQPGYAFKSENYVDSGVKLFKISNVSFGITNWDDVSYLPSSYLDKFKQYELKIGDLVIAMTRPIVQGGIKISRISSNDCPSLLNQRVGRFIPKSTINLDFLYQCLFNSSFINAISDGAGGSQQPNISGKQIERILIPVPSLEIQKQIAISLSSIDQKFAAEQCRRQALDTLFATLLHDLMTAKIRANEIPV